MSMMRTYLDWNASAPLRAEARAAMVAALDAVGNPSSVHAEGRRARAMIERAREQVAALVNAKPAEVVFTSGATEANNWVMQAGWDVIARAGIEHPSVIAPADASGARIITLAVAGTGEVETGRVAAAEIGRRLLALQLANNETGVVQDVAGAVAWARDAGVHVHTDAVQGPGRIPVDFHSLGVDSMSLSAHKLGGPKGVGALIVRDGLDLISFISGGGQELRRRAGTEDVAGIAGFGAAAAAIRAEQGAVAHMRSLQVRLESEVLSITPCAVIVGAGSPSRLPNTSSIALPGTASETIVIKLDLKGVAVSAGAACSSGKAAASTVLAAMGLAPEVARSAIRVSIGPTTSEADIDAFCAAWRGIAQERSKVRLVA